MQLQVLSQLLIGGSRMVLLCLLMINYTFSIQLYLIFTLFRLKACVAIDVVGNVCQSVLEMFSYFCNYRFTEWWVKPEYIPFLLSTLGAIGACFLKC